MNNKRLVTFDKYIKKQSIIIAIVVFVLITVIIISFSLFQNHLRRNSTIEKLSESAKKQVTMFLPFCLVTEEFGGLKLHLKKVKADENLKDIKIVNELQKQEYIDSSCKAYDKTIVQCSNFLGSHFVVIADMRENDQYYGSLIKIKENEIFDNSFYRLMLIVILGVGLLELIFYLFFRQLFTKHLQDSINFLIYEIKKCVRGKIVDERHYEYKFEEFYIIDRTLKNLIQENKHIQKFAAIGQITQLIAHDVRKPFSTVKSFLSIFDSLKDDSTVLEQAKKDIDQSLVNVESMLNDIMDFSREVKLKTSATELSGVLDVAIRQAAQTNQGKNIDFAYNISHNLKPLFDEQRVVRVFTNIIDNAIEAITQIDSKEHGLITISSQNIEDKGKAYIQISIANDGPAFRQEDIPDLFEKFFTKDKKKGTGLGLASVHKIITLHEGEIRAQNLANNKGVEFILKIPASSELDKNCYKKRLPESIKEASIIESSRDRSEIETIIHKIKKEDKDYRILLLENEALYRASVKDTVRKINQISKQITLYDVGTVAEALKIVEAYELTHAIIDIDLGEQLTGYDFLEAIQGRGINTMIHSNRLLQEDKNKAKNLGADAYVSKPLNVEHLVLFLAGMAIGNATEASQDAEICQNKEQY